VQATDGTFYGTADAGGAYFGGTVFQVTPAGTLTALYNFCSQPNCSDGDEPYAGLLQVSDGNFYGTTAYGGGSGGGTVFRVTRSGSLTTLHSFNGADGSLPTGVLVQASGGNFYGTTSQGPPDEYIGTVFKMTSGGTLTTLYNFCSQPNCADGGSPYAGLVQATDGNFYGTTIYGGEGWPCCGTVFKITPGGTLTTLYMFTGGSDGNFPYAGLVQATDGNFYGTTGFGGANGGGGTFFRITPSGTLTTLYSFCSQPNCADGGGSYGGLVQASDGNFYGTTCCGGAYGSGTVFKMTPTGVLTTLHSFDPDGEYFISGLVQATDGNFYGTTQAAGGNGTVFRVGVVRTCATCRP